MGGEGSDTRMDVSAPIIYQWSDQGEIWTELELLDYDFV